MKAILASAFILASTAWAAAVDSAAGEPQTPGPEAEAKRWLTLVDAGRYGDSWAAADRPFQQKITKAAWIKAVGSTRDPLGAVASRRSIEERRTTSLPGLPDGDYGIIQFSTAFAHKAAGVETVVLTRQPTGWKVDGYFVR